MNPSTFFLILLAIIIAHDNIAREKPEKHPDVSPITLAYDDPHIILIDDDCLEEDLNCCPIWCDVPECCYEKSHYGDKNITIFESPAENIDPDFIITLTLNGRPFCRCPWRH